MTNNNEQIQQSFRTQNQQKNQFHFTLNKLFGIEIRRAISFTIAGKKPNSWK